MTAVDGITGKAQLADPELEVVIVEEFSFIVSKENIENIQTAKKQRPDVTFIVLISTYNEDNLDLLSSVADYVVHWLSDDVPERLGQIADQVFAN